MSYPNSRLSVFSTSSHSSVDLQAVSPNRYPGANVPQHVATSRPLSSQSQTLVNRPLSQQGIIARPTTAPTLPSSARGAIARTTAIYERNLNKTRLAEVSSSALAFLFSEIIQYTQKRVSGINDLERRLNTLGYRVGSRLLEVMVWRAESSSKTPKREIRLLPALLWIHTPLWKSVFGKPADAIEKSVENDDEYMIIDNDPPVTRSISIPRDLSSLNCSAFTAGIVEAVLDGLAFPARVTAHSMPTDQFPLRTVILIKLDRSVVEREEALKT
ncbi:TRAPP subunit trs31 [Tulasnella sp. 419]|nr:TRAPP subunit trs31 [Tulasnella sp. 418]KAG8962282.1 TRAPP subunit trs31 [Tulasnella sp. 419]